MLELCELAPTGLKPRRSNKYPMHFLGVAGMPRRIPGERFVLAFRRQRL